MVSYSEACADFIQCFIRCILGALNLPMKNVFLSAVVLLLNLACLPSFSQSTQHQRIIITDADAQVNAGALIRLFAEGYQKPPRSTQFILETDQSVQAMNKVAKVVSGKFKVSGDTWYRGFDLSELLYPDQLYFTVLIKSGNTSKDYPLHVKVVNGTPETVSVPYSDSSENKIIVTAVDLKAKYAAAGINAVQQKAALINDYYQTAGDVDHHAALLSTINAYDYPHFRENIQMIERERAFQQQVNERNFDKTLPLTLTDPGRLNEKLRAFGNLVQRKKSEMDQVLLTLHLVFFDRGLQAMKDNNRPFASQLFHDALELNPRFAPALLQLARLDFLNREYYQAECKAEDILYQMTPDPQTRNAVLDLISDIYETHLELGAGYNESKRFNEAITEYEAAGVICKKYVSVRCSDELGNGIRKARLGIFTNMLNDARSQVQRNDFVKAEQLVNKAQAYHDAYNNDLPASNEASDLLKAIRQKKYEQILYGAKQYYNRGSYEQALTQYQLADSLVHLYNLTSTSDAAESEKLTARQLILQNLSNGETDAAGNNLQSARRNLRAVTDMQNRYGMSGDTELQTKVKSLQGKILSQQCINVQQQIDDEYRQSVMLISKKSFIEAQDHLNKASALATNNFECMLVTDSVTKTTARIRPAAEFQQLVQNSSEADRNGDYGKALTFYDQSSVYYRDAHIEEFGLQHDPSLHNFITQTASNGLVNYVAEQYMNKGQLEESLDMYKLLISRKVDAKLMEGSLYRLGVLLGKRDYQRDPAGKAKVNEKKYTMGDNNLKRLAKGYRKGYHK